MMKTPYAENSRRVFPRDEMLRLPKNVEPTLTPYLPLCHLPEFADVYAQAVTQSHGIFPMIYELIFLLSFPHTIVHYPTIRENYPGGATPGPFFLTGAFLGAVTPGLLF